MTDTEPEIVSHLHTQPDVDAHRVSQTIVGTSEGGEGLKIRPVRYRYVLADIRTGRMFAVLPVTGVNYSVGIYSGRELSGTIYLPDMYLDQMVHPPSNDFERWPHWDRSNPPLATMFEVGNVAIYVMRNETVVWGGILWSRAYSSGAKTMQITALSWEGYIYYRLLRRSVVFTKETDRYTIWYAMMRQLLTDYTWRGTNNAYANSGVPTPGGEPLAKYRGRAAVWTGLRGSNPPLTTYEQQWPYNAPPIQLPPATLKFGSLLSKATVKETFRGYDMNVVGPALEQWADTQTLITYARFEYRVVCWFDTPTQTFRQSYVVGTMNSNYPPNATSIVDPLLGRPKTRAGEVIFDFPGHISEWGMIESMEECATRVVLTGDTKTSKGTKATVYAAQKNLLNVPTTGARGSQGWLLYDHLTAHGAIPTKSASESSWSKMQRRADTVLARRHVPQAAQIDYQEAANTGRRTSSVATELTITLYRAPTTSFPTWEVGDWVTFVIADPFYGGKMYLVRRIIGYTVTVIPDHESDYSHEQIVLELTDDTDIEEGE